MDFSKLGPYLLGGAAALIATLFAYRARAGSGRPAFDVGTPPPPPPHGWTDQDFRDLAAAAARLRMNPADLLAVLTSESGLSPTARNPRDPSEYPIAVGLNQLTAVSNGATGLTDEQRIALLDQPVSAQIPYVERYFANQLWTRAGRSYPTAAAIYAINFAPGRAYDRGLGSNVVLYTTGDGKAYTLNSAFDLEHKGYITVGDLGRWLDRRVVHDTGSTGRLYRGALAAMQRATGDDSLSPLTA